MIQAEGVRVTVRHRSHENDVNTDHPFIRVEVTLPRNACARNKRPSPHAHREGPLSVVRGYSDTL